MARQGAGIAAIFGNTAASPSALSARAPERAVAFFIAFLSRSVTFFALV